MNEVVNTDVEVKIITWSTLEESAFVTSIGEHALQMPQFTKEALEAGLEEEWRNKIDYLFDQAESSVSQS